MPLTRFKLSAIEDGGIATADLADGAVTTAKLADSAVTSVKTSNLFTNTEIAGTEAARMPVGTTAERANEQSGDLRFNSTLSLMEYYDGTQWKAIDSPPVVSSVSPDNFDTDGDTITITGSNFQSGLTVKVIANDGSEFSASTVTFTNSTTASFDITAAMVADEDDPYDVQVTNPSGLFGTLADALDFAPEPVFATASGTLGTIFDVTRSSYSLSAVTATSTESDATLTYALGSGDSLPAGLSLNASTGAITGTATAVGSNTTTTFDIVATATDGDSNVTTNTRSFSITVNAPVITSYTTVGSGTFTVPSGLTTVDVLVVAGGGAGGMHHAAGGGAGGLIYRPAFPVTPGGSVSYTVGQGGNVSEGYTAIFTSSDSAGLQGKDSVFGTLTAKGGGHGSYGASGPTIKESPGGSGGGGNYNQSYTVGTGTQPQQPGDSGTYGFGNPGGQSGPGPRVAGGGGGGAGATGGNGSPPNGYAGAGGVGKQYDISGTQTYYAGGGGGGGHTGQQIDAAGGAGGQGGGGRGDDYQRQDATSGQANRGGGGGSKGSADSQPGGDLLTPSGGSGIVIVKY